jgi:hypothetical protein
MAESRIRRRTAAQRIDERDRGPVAAGRHDEIGGRLGERSAKWTASSIEREATTCASGSSRRQVRATASEPRRARRFTRMAMSAGALT